MNILKTQLTSININRSKKLGFTMIELIITVTVASILIAVAVPAMQELIRKNRMEGESQRLVTLLAQARNAAMTGGRPAFLCRLDTTKNLTSGSENYHCLGTNPLNTGGWAVDILVYSQLPDTITATPNSSYGNQRINRFGANQAARRGMVLTVSEVPNTSIVVRSNRTDRVIRFNPDGTLVNSTPFRIAVCDNGDVPEQYGRIIEIGAAGQIRSSKIEVTDDDRDCTPTSNA